MKWISVNDRLPEISRTVLIYRKSLHGANIYEAFRDLSFNCAPVCSCSEEIIWATNYGCCSDTFCPCSSSITHWAALPEPPPELTTKQALKMCKFNLQNKEAEEELKKIIDLLPE